MKSKIESSLTVVIYAALVLLLIQAIGSYQSAPVSEATFSTGSDNVLWPQSGELTRLSEIGRGKAVVFSPDFSVPDNREFYEKLGFDYYESANWEEILSKIQTKNPGGASNKIQAVVLETHGTNGNGLKLQTGDAAADPRSYASIGALRQRLEAAEVQICIVAACNAGRLFRPEIYDRLNSRPNDPLFKPATLGIINATQADNAAQSSGQRQIAMVRRSDSLIEALCGGWTRELSPVAQRMLGLATLSGDRIVRVRNIRFIISTTLIQILTNDPALRLTSRGFVTEKSPSRFANQEAEAIFQSFVKLVNRVAEAEKSQRRS